MSDERQQGPAPTFTDSRVPRAPRAVVLVLHGGADRDPRPVDATSLSWWRGRKLLRDVAPRLTREDVGLVLLRYRYRGWSARREPVPPPVSDARWALDELDRRHGVPVVVLGHSMGGRTGVAVADHPSVRGVVALAPWLSPGDSADPLRGKVLRAAHGSVDRITSARATEAFVGRAARHADATFTDMGPVGHYLIKRVGAWNDFAVDGVREVLDRADGTG